MTNTTLRGMAAALVLISGLGSAAAQESTNVVATEGDWTVFAQKQAEDEPMQLARVDTVVAGVDSLLHRLAQLGQHLAIRR